MGDVARVLQAAVQGYGEPLDRLELGVLQAVVERTEAHLRRGLGEVEWRDAMDDCCERLMGEAGEA